jgi:hypothetical protein
MFIKLIGQIYYGFSHTNNSNLQKKNTHTQLQTQNTMRKTNGNDDFKYTFKSLQIKIIILQQMIIHLPTPQVSPYKTFKEVKNDGNFKR